MARVIPLPRPHSSEPTMLAALYGRASRDRHKRGRSIRDQFAVAEIECEERGWGIYGRYEDRDRSATRRAVKAREDFERLMADAQAGRFGVIVYAERSRISRNLHHSLELRDLCVESGVLLCYDGRVYDMRKPADFKEFTRDAVQSEEEGEAIIARNQRTARIAAKRGGVWAHIPLGYKRQYDPDTGELVGQVEHPEEAEVVRALFRGIESGQSLRSLIPLVTPYRPTMGMTGLRNLLLNVTYLGVRKHQGEEYPAVWPALVEEDVFWRVQKILTDPSRRTNHASGVVHLLSGIPLCAVCRAAGNFRIAPLRIRDVYRGGRYGCRESHVQTMERALDAFVEEAVLQWLGSTAARTAFQAVNDDGEVERQRARASAMAEQLAEARKQAAEFDPATGLARLSIASLAALEQQLLPLIHEAEGRARELLTSGDQLIDRLAGMTESDLDQVWNHELDVAQRRYIIQKVVRIELRRSPKLGRSQDMSQRVGLIFVGEPGFAEWPRFPASSHACVSEPALPGSGGEAPEG